MSVKRILVLVAIVLSGAGVAMGQTIWDQYPGNPVLGPGDPGTWDAGGRGAATVVFDGSVHHAWFIGFIAGGYWNGIGHATSPDGLPPWTMDPVNPVLTHGAPGEWDDSYVFDHSVIFDGILFHMWYAGGDGSFRQGGYATSPDGSAWTRHPGNPVLPVGPPGSFDEFIAGPASVILDGGTYKMWYTGCTFPPGALCQIGYAESADGTAWNKEPDPVLVPGNEGDWDEVVGNPSVVRDGSTYHMLFAGQTDDTRIDIGYAYSGDGTHWMKYGGNPVIQTADHFAFLAPFTIEGPTFRTWYTHIDGLSTWTSYASSECCAGLFSDDFETGDTSLWSTTVP